MATDYEKKRFKDNQLESPEAIKAEVDGWMKIDPFYAKFVEGVRETLRARERASYCEHEPYSRVSHAKATRS